MKGRGTDPEAHRLFLQARHFIDRITREDTAKGIGYLKEALALDPEFALAWAELGRAYASEADWGWAPAAEGYGRAREAVARALALEPDLAEGHAGMGWIQMMLRLGLARCGGVLSPGAGAGAGKCRGASPGRHAGREPGPSRRGDRARSPRGGAGPVECSGLFQPRIDALGSGPSRGGGGGVSERRWSSPRRERATRASLSIVLLAQGRGEEALAEALREPEEWVRLCALAIIHHAAGRRSRIGRRRCGS